MSSASVANPMRPESTMSVRGEFWTCNAIGEPKQDITHVLEECTVNIDWLGPIKATMNARLKQPVTLRPLIDCLMPRMVIEWWDINAKKWYINEPLGVFYFLFPDQEVHETYTMDLIEGVDGLWRLEQLTADELLWIPEGADHGEEAYKLLYGKAGDMNLSGMGRTGTKTTKPRTVRPNDRLLEHATALYDTADWWDLAPDRYGRITTSQRTVLGNSLPMRKLITEDVLGMIQVQPDREAFCNQVFLSSNAPEADLTMRDGYKVSFVDPDSPYSVVNTFPVSHELADARDESFETLRHRAIMMLETAAGIQERLIVPTWPDPRFDPRESWELNITQDREDGVKVAASGMFRVEGMQFALTPGSLAQVSTLSHLVNTEKFFEE